MQNYTEQFETKSKLTLKVFTDDLAQIRATGANPAMLNGVNFDYYGTMTPLNQIASISAPNATTLVVKPYDKGTIKIIVALIHDMKSGLSPIEDGDSIKIPVPPLNDEKRQQYIKLAKDLSEKAKISIRNLRQDLINKVKKDADLNDDLKRDAEADIQKQVIKANESILKIFKEKEAALSKI